MTTMAYASIYGVFGLNEVAYHVFLILLHAINTFLVFTLLQKLKFSRVASLLAALVFLIHPAQTTSISYIAGVPDVLSPFFILLGLTFFMNKKAVYLTGAVLCFILAILTKELGIILFGLTALIAIYNWKNYKTSERKSKIIFFIILAALTAIYFWLRINYLNSGELSLNRIQNIYTESLLVRIMTFIATIWDYAVLTFAPVTLYFDRVSFHHETLLTFRGIFGLTVTIGGLIWSYISFKKNKKFFLGFLWFFISLGPVSGLIPANAIYRENWLYVPLIGIGILLAMSFDQMKTKKAKSIFLTTLIVAMLLLGTRTIYRNAEWADAHAFFENEIENNKHFPRIYNAYARLHFKEENYEKAIEIFEEGISITAPDNQLLIKMRNDLASAYVITENYNKAISNYLRIFDLEPNYIKSHEELAKLFAIGKHPERSAKFTEFAERIKNGGAVTFEEIRETEKLK